jgi:hypothetical protein
MPGSNVALQKLDESLLEAMNNDSIVNNILQQDAALRVRYFMKFQIIIHSFIFIMNSEKINIFNFTLIKIYVLSLAS